MKPRLFSVDEVLVVARYVRALRDYMAKPPDEAADKFADLVAERERCLRWVYFHGIKLTHAQYNRVRKVMRDPGLGAKVTPTRAERALINKRETKNGTVRVWNYTAKEKRLLGMLTSEPGGRPHIHNRTWSSSRRGENL